MIVDDLAVVAGSEIGVAGVDLASHAIRFQRPIRGHVPLPAVLDGALLAVGDCDDPIDAQPGHQVIGCYTVLDTRVEAVLGEGSIVAAAKVAPPAGPATLALDDRTATLSSPDGDPVRFDVPDPPRGPVEATALPRRRALAPPARPTVSFGEGKEQVDLWLSPDNVLELRYADPSLMTARAGVVGYASAPGALAAVGDRAARAFQLVPGEAAIQPVVVHVDGLDIRSLGAAVPGISLLAAAQSATGFAIAVRLDATLLHDYVAAFTGDGTLAWVYPLPPPPGPGRALPVGLALTRDAVVVFHDGAIVAALPAP
jgi:hypothetical protein